MPSTNIAMFILLGLFLFLILIRLPVAFSLAVATFSTAVYLKIPAMVVAQQMVTGISSFSLIAIPFFIVSGEIMGQGGISSRLIDFADVIIGRMRGGLAMVNILASMFFGGISGSAVADTSSIGPVMIPMMEKAGYDTDYSVAVTVTSSVQGIIIPPSHNMIIYSVAAGGVSVGNMFLAGILPGMFLGLMLMVISYWLAVKRNYPKGGTYTFKEAWTITKESVLGLMTAVIILVGVTTGWFTATESAAMAALWAFFVTFFVYKDIKIKQMSSILANSLRTLAMVMALISTSSGFAWMMAYLRIPALITETLLSISDNKIFILLLINLILLLLGTIMDMAPLILIVTPILLPVVMNVGMSPIQFGIVLMLNLGIGLITPPVGSVLFVGCSIGGISMESITRTLVPFYVTMFLTLMALTFIPALTLFIPSVFGI